MKRTLSLILIFLLIFTLSGCNRFSKNEETESHKETNEEEGTKATKSLDDMRYVAEFIHDETPSLEKCITSVTHVVEAKFIKRTTFCREENNYRSAYLQYMYEFEVVKCLRGSNVPTKLFLPDKFQITDKAYQLVKKEGYYAYKEGQNYLLLLSYSHDEVSASFAFIESTLTLDIDSKGEIDVSNSLIYESPIEKYIETAEAKQALEDGNLLTYILNAVKDNPEVIKYGDYIESDDFFEIYDATPYVALVRIEEPAKYPRNTVGYDYGKAYSCEVLTWIKGEAEDETIDITLPLSKIEKTGNYVLLLDPNDYGTVRFWHLSGYQSVYSEDEVADWLKK